MIIHVYKIIWWLVLTGFSDFMPIYEDPDVINRYHWLEVNEFDRMAVDLMQFNFEEARNVVIFVGDGLGPETITASRIYGMSEEKYFFFERFPFVGKLKTYVADKMVPHCSSTAMFCGAKGNDMTAGVDATVELNDCESSIKSQSRLVSLFSLAQKEGKETGFVTNGRITEDTVASLYAHVANTKWECEALMTNSSKKCKDIARQLIEDEPGKSIKVIMGGGMQCLKSEVSGSLEDPIDKSACYSTDGRDLIRSWILEKEKRHASHAVVTNTWELEKLTYVDYLLGVFSNSQFRYEYKRDSSPRGMPSLSEMAEKALYLLMQNEHGFFLVIENALIDKAHHEGHAKIALEEVIALDDAVEKVVTFLEESDILQETLVIVTSDHSSGLVMSGYPSRHSSILGLAEPSRIDYSNFTNLAYATGGLNSFQLYADDSVGNLSILLNPTYNRTFLVQETKTVYCPQQKIRRIDPSKQNTADFKYVLQAGILTDEVAHTGTDVNVYALGPMSHLIHGTHEQTYLYYFIGFATNVGPLTRVTDYADYLF